VLLLAECDLSDDQTDPLLLALAHRNAFVLNASIAHPAQLFEGVSSALTFAGPALINIHAPSPGRHGFAQDATIERAHLAVRSRVHPLLKYDPAQEGIFGKRITLAGNLELDHQWLGDVDGDQPYTPALWAAGESRFEGLAVSDDAWGERWATLQELSGVATPFTEAVRDRLESELRQAHQDELAAQAANYEAKLVELKANQSLTQATRLRDRLMQLAGFGGSVAKGSKEDNKQS
jgi:pyruvate-ferredoxin/flavodoxin oxidoreductase